MLFISKMIYLRSVSSNTEGHNMQVLDKTMTLQHALAEQCTAVSTAP